MRNAIKENFKMKVKNENRIVNMKASQRPTFNSTEKRRSVEQDYCGNNYVFNYYLKDHLGNNRVVIDVSSGNNPTKVQATDYYSFGLPYAYGTLKQLIAFEADFAPYQPDKQKAVDGVKTYWQQVSNLLAGQYSVVNGQIVPNKK
jgi:hypothetical protein